jgi:hypothetical protein
MHMRTVLPTLSLLGALGLAACNEPSPGEGIPQEQFLTELPAAQCAHAVRCGSIGRSEEASCRSRLASANNADSPTGYSYREALSAGRLSFDGVAARKCLDYYRALRCGEDGENSDDHQACGRIYRPRVADGGTCRAGIECNSYTCDTSGPVGCPGVCVPGSLCNRLTCDEDSFCDAQTRACVPRRPRGAACSPSFDHTSCQPGLVCIGGVCEVPQQSGGTCGGLTGLCAVGFYCDTDTVTCKPRLGAESLCGSSGECQDGLLCVFETIPSPTPGVCKPVLDFPSACDPDTTTAPAICPAHAQCDPNTRQCVERPRPEPGASCTSEACPQGIFYCDEGTLTCKVPLAIGAACTPPSSSDPGYNPCGLSGRCDAATQKCVLACE